VGAIYLACGHRQDEATEPARACHLLPIAWERAREMHTLNSAVDFVEAVNRAQLH